MRGLEIAIDGVHAPRRVCVVVEITEEGRPLSEDDIVNLEGRIGCRLPEPYRRFLLKYNGGRPTPDADTIDIERLPGSPTDIGDAFHYGRNKEFRSPAVRR